MRIAVVGAGIVGVSTAYELAADGHEVTVLERHSSVAAEASFANGGLLGPATARPWSASGSAARRGSELFGRRRGLRARPGFDAAAWRWLWRYVRSGDAPSYAQQQASWLTLARYSQQRLHALRERLPLEYERAQGLLQLLRTERERDALQGELARWREQGLGLRELDATACYAIEPGLNRDQPLVGAIHWPQDEVGNCRQVAHLLREAAERLGVEFRFGSVVRALRPEPAGGTLLQLEQVALSTGFASSRAGATQVGGPAGAMAHRARAAARYLDPVSQEHFDAVVVAAGADSAALLSALGLQLPMMPVYGYSLTAPVRSIDRGPKGALIDTREQVSISRIGQRLRVSGGAELGGSARRQRAAAVALLYRVLNDWFPGAAHIARPQLWKGARPVLPDGPPLIGPGPTTGVWLNLGHGASGWSLACGSARLLADQIAGRAPALDPAPFALQRDAAGR